MIPKKIHYCWFGRGEMPELAHKCIESWHKYLPDYEYKLWNEDTFDINSVPYVKEAYEARKFAFVTDYIRLYALSTEGGIYMDTDVEVLKPLDDLLTLSAFAGYEGSRSGLIGTGLIASEAHGVWIEEQLSYYENRHFLKENGEMDITANPVTVSQIMMNNGFVCDGKKSVYKNDMHVFPVDYFCPKNSIGELKLTENSYCIHHFAGSWCNPTMYQKFKKAVSDFLGVGITSKIVAFKRKIVKNKK